MLNDIELLLSKYDIRDYHIKSEKTLPEKFSCEIKVPVKDQGQQLTCVAHATASVMEYRYKKSNDKKYRCFSTEFIYGIREIGYYVGDGMRIKDALKTITKYGDPFKTDCPGNNDVKQAITNINKNIDTYKELAYPNRVSAYYRCKTPEEIKTALIKHGPVLVAMKTYYDSKLVNDVYTYDPDSKFGRHCVMLYGYDERGWLIQNSWGKDYAGDGRFVIPYDYKFSEAWGISHDPETLSDGTLRKPGKFVSIIYKVYNALVNLYLDAIHKNS